MEHREWMISVDLLKTRIFEIVQIEPEAPQVVWNEEMKP